VDTYLNRAALEKPITNQRLWGLTGVASFARLVGEENRFADMAHASIAHAFEDMLPDGFFRYYPDAPKYDAFAGYDGMTTFYQSRHIAFIVYALDTLGLSRAPYQARLDQATRALLSMYRSEGYKDMRMECKRWYWQSPYEVASHGFDAFALATSDVPGTQTALTNVLHLIRTHARSGYLRSDLGPDINFQCPIFWTAHLAWMLRIKEAQQRFDGATQIVPFTYEFKGEQVYTYTAPGKRVLVNGYDGLRNPTVGIIEHSSIDSRGRWRATLPALPPALFESVREVANHTWYALRGFHLHEAVVRIACFMRDLFVMLLPRYTARYGKIERITYDERGQQVSITVALRPATKYGDLLPHTELFTLNPYA
jgi:YD repeat-containing protein